MLTFYYYGGGTDGRTDGRTSLNWAKHERADDLTQGRCVIFCMKPARGSVEIGVGRVVYIYGLLLSHSYTKGHLKLQL